MKQECINAYHYAIKNKIIKEDALLIEVDFTLPSSSKRLSVYKNPLDGLEAKCIYYSYVTHGSGSGGVYPTQFSNLTNSHQSSIGVFKTAEIYTGKHGLSCRIDGLEKFNNKARSRSIVIHGAEYIQPNDPRFPGRSHGCFAVPQNEVNDFIKVIRNGALLVAYYPDADWLNNSKFLKGI